MKKRYVVRLSEAEREEVESFDISPGRTTLQIKELKAAPAAIEDTSRAPTPTHVPMDSAREGQRSPIDQRGIGHLRPLSRGY